MKSIREPAGIRCEPLVIRDARERAARQVADAEARALALLDAARRDAAALRALAVADGKREGAEASVAEWAAALEGAREALTVTEREVASLAMEVARTVLGREAESGASVVEATAKKALARVRRARSIVLRVHPSDEAVARAKVAQWLPPGSEPSTLEVCADDAVSRGGVLVECELGRIDATLETQLDAIARALEPR